MKAAGTPLLGNKKTRPRGKRGRVVLTDINCTKAP
jgi:hypothetical protein